MEVPGAVAQTVQSGEELVGLAVGGGEVFDDLGLGEAGVGPHGPRQGRGEQQLRHLGGGVAAEVGVDLLRAGVAVVGDVVDHGRQQRRVDALDLVAHLRVVQVEVLRTDQEDVVGLAVPHAAQQPRRELHQAAGLAEALVLLEQGHQVLERGMEGVGLADLFGDLLHGPGGDVATVLRGLDLLGEGLGHGVDQGLARQLGEQALLEDLVDLVPGELDRGDGLGLAPGLLLEIGHDPRQVLGLGVVAA
jgi:plasmid stabilization system protein ParE